MLVASFREMRADDRRQSPATNALISFSQVPAINEYPAIDAAGQNLYYLNKHTSPFPAANDGHSRVVIS